MAQAGKLKMDCEDTTKYLPHNPIGVEYRWYVYDPCEIDSLTKQPRLHMVGSKQACEQYITRLEGR